MDTHNQNCFQFVYRLTVKTTLTYMHWERQSGNPKDETFSKYLQPAAKNAKQKSRYILRATETSVEEKFFPRRYSVFKPKICNGFELNQSKRKRK